MKSTRSVRSLRSIRSSKSKSGMDARKTDEPMECLDNLLVVACSRFNCPYSVNVKKESKDEVFFKNLKQVDAKGRARRMSYAPQPEKTSKPSTSNSENTSNISEDSSFRLNTITVTVVYDNSTLTEILIANRTEIPVVLLKVIRVLAPFYKSLRKFTISRCRINMYTLYELSKILKNSTIESICLDGSQMPLGDFTMLLETSNLTSLSLCRCNINDNACELIASMLHCSAPADNLSILNLSSNRITDVGVKCIAEALRSNRHLRYLNLADNSIDDAGASYILDVLMEFPLTYDEILTMKKKRLEYFRLRNTMYAKYFSEFCNRSLEDLSDSRLSGSKRKKSRPSIKKDKSKLPSWTNEDCVQIRAEMMTADILGPYKGPFSPEVIKYEKRYYYSLGNTTLVYLNLAYNNLSYISVQKLCKVITYQRALRPGKSGLTKIVIDGNNLPKTCYEMDCINENLVRKVTRYSGRISEIVKFRKGK